MLYKDSSFYNQPMQQLNILLAGQKWFGAEVFAALAAIPSVKITYVVAPSDPEKPDRLWVIGSANEAAMIPSGILKIETMPSSIDLIVTAHSHDFIGEQTRLKARLGAIGYHPSLLPLHRGRDAVSWAIKMGDKVTGGSVYQLSNKTDGGRVLLQQHVFIRPDDTAETLWRRDLAPLGIKLLTETVKRYAAGEIIVGKEQDETLATWEPSCSAPPLYKPDLIMLPAF